MKISWEHSGIYLHLVGPSESPQRKMEPQVPGTISILGPSSNRRRLLPTGVSPMGQARSYPSRTLGEVPCQPCVCVEELICPGGCGTNPTCPQCSGTKQQQDPVGFPQGPPNPRAIDNEMGSPHPKYFS